MESVPVDPAEARARFEDALKRACAALGIVPDAEQIGLLWSHLERVIDTNRRMNLTRITDPAEAAVKHVADSMAVLADDGLDAAQPLRVLDIGTGAGFPAVPVAVMRPAWRVLAIDGTGKKAQFVEETAQALRFGNLRARHMRAETMRRDAATRYDLVLLRAVSKLAEHVSLAGPLLAPGGLMVSYKTHQLSDDELVAGRRAAAQAGLIELKAIEIDLPLSQETLRRRLIRYRKRS